MERRPPEKRRTRSSAVGIGLIFLLSWGPKPSVAGERADPLEWSAVVVSISINRQAPSQSVIAYRDRQNHWCIPIAALAAARLATASIAVHAREDMDRCVNAERLNPAAVQFDESTQTLSLDFSPKNFSETMLRPGTGQTQTNVIRNPSGFLNYDITLDRSDAGLGRSMYFEAGVSSNAGVLISNHAFIDQPGRSNNLRLDTTYVVDQPARLATLRIGDGISKSFTALGRSVRFGGIQFGTNFGTQPGFITAPMATLSSQAALPSTVDVFVNNTLQSTASVPPGPFSITVPPVLGGDGEVLLKVRDLSGREEVVRERLYVSGVMLAPGVSDFSIEAGMLRKNVGIVSNDYGNAFVSGGIRRGILSSLTTEFGFASGEHRQLGLHGGINLALPGIGLFTGAIAWGSNATDSGNSVSLGFEKRWRRQSLSMRTQRANTGFRQLGVETDFRLLRTDNLFYGYSIDGVGTISAGHTRIERSESSSIQIENLAFSTKMFNWGHFMVSLSQTRANTTVHAINFLWSLPLGAGLSSSVFHTQPSDAEPRSTVQLQRSLSTAEGYGYRLQTGVRSPHQASLFVQGRYGLARFDAAEFGGNASARASFGGAVALVDGEWFAGRRIGGSFGVVRLPGMSNVRVYVDNLSVGRTDESGTVFLPRLNAYARNNVRVEPLDLPLDVQIGALKAEPVPAWRSGTRVDFPIRPIAAATLNLYRSDGTPVPAGATARFLGRERNDGNGDDEPFVVGHGGLLYLTGLTDSNELLVQWAGQECRLTVPYELKRGSIPYLGEFTCTAGDRR